MKLRLWNPENTSTLKFPPEFEVENITALPVAKPSIVVVPSSLAIEYAKVALANPYEDGTMQDAILFGPRVEDLEDPLAYFATLLREGIWRELKDSLLCDWMYQAEFWVSDDDLEPLITQWSHVRVDFSDEAMLVQALRYLPEEKSEHLSTCETCQELFLDKAKVFVTQRRGMFVPPNERIVAHRNGEPDAWVTIHFRKGRNR